MIKIRLDQTCMTVRFTAGHKGERVILKGESPVDIQVSEPRRGRESKFLRLQPIGTVKF